MKLKTDNQNFNKKIIMKKLVLVVAMFMFACGSFFTMAQDPVKKDPKKEVKDTAKTEPKKEVADTTAITVAAQLLDIDRKTLYNKLKLYGIDL